MAETYLEKLEKEKKIKPVKEHMLDYEATEGFDSFYYAALEFTGRDSDRLDQSASASCHRVSDLTSKECLLRSSTGFSRTGSTDRHSCLPARPRLTP